MDTKDFAKKTYQFFKGKMVDEHFFIQEEICAICIGVMTPKQRDKAFKLCEKHFKEQEERHLKELNKFYVNMGL